MFRYLLLHAFFLVRKNCRWLHIISEEFFSAEPAYQMAYLSIRFSGQQSPVDKKFLDTGMLANA
jgi:hypothetical protein